LWRWILKHASVLAKGIDMRIGLLHPGSMGVSVGASAINSGHDVLWASEGRSTATAERAKKHGLMDMGSVREVVAQSEIMLSICPPDAAVAVADVVKEHGFRGTFVDCNAISPMRMKHIAEHLEPVGVRVVDGGLIGHPAWVANKTFLYLAGARSDDVAACFAAGPLVARVMPGKAIGDASALKMCYAAYTKGTTAILCALLATADELGVREELNDHWNIDQAGRAAERENIVSNVTQKAWRWTGEMHEIAATFQSVGLPEGFHEAAATLYQRLEGLKDGPHPTPVADVLAALKGKG
jgi:3-hydroxyisobutyrate dehydrogenase-like beta-hydroxyacid dehydrogenase